MAEPRVRKEDSHIKWTGVLVGNRHRKNPVLWVFPEVPLVKIYFKLSLFFQFIIKYFSTLKGTANVPVTWIFLA